MAATSSEHQYAIILSLVQKLNVEGKRLAAHQEALLQRNAKVCILAQNFSEVFNNAAQLSTKSHLSK